jgi:predicted TIM-barrel fold metal-dependent hydrolase
MRRTGISSIASLAAIILGCASSPRPSPQPLGRIDPPLVDHHQHFFSSPLANLVNPNPLPPGAAAVEPIDADKLIALLDSAGIRRALVLALGYSWGNPSRNVENEYEKVKAENDWVAEQVARYPDRLRAFCSFNPLRDYALDELARCAANPNLRSGLKLHIANSRVDYHDAQHLQRLRRVFRAANERRIPIVIHMRASISQRLRYGREEARIFLDSILPAAPDILVQIAHLAGAGGYDATADSALSVFVDAVARRDPRVNQLWFDVTGVARNATDDDAKRIAARIRQLGIQRILYGSDAATGGNLPPREAWADFLKLPLTDAEFRTIASNVAPYMR